jgi:hypothetical protein
VVVLWGLTGLVCDVFATGAALGEAFAFAWFIRAGVAGRLVADERCCWLGIALWLPFGRLSDLLGGSSDAGVNGFWLVSRDALLSMVIALSGWDDVVVILFVPLASASPLETSGLACVEAAAHCFLRTACLCSDMANGPYPAGLFASTVCGALARDACVWVRGREGVACFWRPCCALPLDEVALGASSKESLFA